MKEYRGCYLKIRGNIFVMGGVKYAFTVAATGQKTSLIAERDMDEKCLTPKRTEYGKQVRREYESGQLNESRHNMQQLEPREDGLTNTLTSVQKDNLLLCGDDEVQPAAMRGGGGLEPKVQVDGKKYRIRKLTERECFRLMDVDEKDIDTIQAAGISKTQQYKLAGNSIVVSCLYHLFRKMFIEPANEERQQTLW